MAAGGEEVVDCSPIETRGVVPSASSPSILPSFGGGSVAKVPPTNHLAWVSRKAVLEAMAQVFNVTLLDMRRLVEQTGDEKDLPRVELVLEDMETSGLGLEPNTGCVSPPAVFVRALVGDNHSSGFTTFTSTSATKALCNTLTLDVNNMYNDNILLQVWHASEAPVVESTSAPVLDILSRLITSATHRSTKDNATQANKITDDSASTNETKKDPLPDITISASNITPRKGSSDSKNSESAGVESMQNGERQEGIQEHSKGHLDTSDTISVTSDFSPEDQRTSTPRGRSSSFQSLELSGLESKKGKKHKDHTKVSISNFKSSLRASFRRGSQSNLGRSTTSVASETNEDKTSKSFNHDEHSKDGEDETEIATSTSKDGEKGKLKRSGSLLSVKSFSRMNFASLRLSSQKASEVMRRIGTKKGSKSQSVTSTPQPYRKELNDDDSRSLTSLQDGDDFDNENTPSPPRTDRIDDDSSEIQHKEMVLDVTPTNTSYRRRSFKSIFTTPRTLRTFKSFREKNNKKHEAKSTEVGHSPDPKFETPKASVTLDLPQHPSEIQNYLTSIGKAHLTAQLVAYHSLPIKNLVMTWKKEAWLPLELVQSLNPSATTSQKKRKPMKAGIVGGSGSGGQGGGVGSKRTCKFHLRLTLPQPECELTTTGYDTYSITLRKLVQMKIEKMESVKHYKGEVDSLGEVLLQQLVYFSRVSEPHRTLAKWLVLVDVKPSDPILLLPLLLAIKVHLEAGLYLTLQKRELSCALVNWVRKALTGEFEMLHSSFPYHTDLLEITRLEHFLRCFNTVETCYELRVMFEREMASMGLACLTDLLQAALNKHVDTWVEALNKEQLTGAGEKRNSNQEGSLEWLNWQDAQRRATHLTKPILDFLTISSHTYQPIFMVELSVDYLYLVMPKMVRAAVHQINPLLRYDVEGQDQVPSEALPGTVQAAWVLLTNLSNVNMIGIDSRLPQHLIPQEYRDAFNVVALQWFALSKHLALREIERDIEEDLFVAVDESEGYSQSSVGVADLMKAMMNRVGGLRWPGGVGPGGKTLARMGQQMMELVDRYSQRLTQAYVDRGQHSETISTQACVVVRSVEHVCDEVQQHLESMAGRAEEHEVKQQLQDRTHHLQEHVDDAVEILLKQCVPRVEQLLGEGVHKGSWQYVVEGMKEAVRPVEDRLYYAEPLLQQLWFTVLDHAKGLKDTYVQGELREYLRRLRVVLVETHNFFTNQGGIGLSVPEVVAQEYESLQSELLILGATSAELVSQFYQERFSEQQKEEHATPPAIVINATFTENGLRVHVVQAMLTQHHGALVKVRLEPSQWFPETEPQKTQTVKDNPAVFNQVMEFPGVKRGYGEDGRGGVLTFQVRTPKLFSSTTVHNEAVLPLSQVTTAAQEDVLRLPHIRLPLTRPWMLSTYKPLEALRTRALDKSASDFLKALSERWEPNETSSVKINDSQKLASFVRAGTVRSSMKGGRKTSIRGALVK